MGQRAKGKGKRLWVIGNGLFCVYQIVATFLDCLNSLSAVTRLAFSMIEVAAMILSAGSLLLSESKPAESHAISGVIKGDALKILNNFYYLTQNERDQASEKAWGSEQKAKVKGYGL